MVLVQHLLGRLDVELVLGALLPGDRDEPVDVVPADRITSYNVCYTKLLRLTGRL